MYLFLRSIMSVPSIFPSEAAFEEGGEEFLLWRSLYDHRLSSCFHVSAYTNTHDLRAPMCSAEDARELAEALRPAVEDEQLQAWEVETERKKTTELADETLGIEAYCAGRSGLGPADAGHWDVCAGEATAHLLGRVVGPSALRAALPWQEPLRLVLRTACMHAASILYCLCRWRDGMLQSAARGESWALGELRHLLGAMTTPYHAVRAARMGGEEGALVEARVATQAKVTRQLAAEPRDASLLGRWHFGRALAAAVQGGAAERYVRRAEAFRAGYDGAVARRLLQTVHVFASAVAVRVHATMDECNDETNRLAVSLMWEGPRDVMLSLVVDTRPKLPADDLLRSAEETDEKMQALRAGAVARRLETGKRS